MTMENDNVELSAVFAAVKRRKGLMITVFLLGLIATVLTAVLLPSIYRSAAIVQIEQQEIPQDLVRSTITSYADQRIQMIGQRIQSAPNLERLIKKYDLYEEELRTEGLEEVFLMMRDDINLQMISADVIDPRSGRATQANIAFNLAFDSEDPAMAQRVANELVSLFLSENQEVRTQQAKDTAQFLEAEAEKLQRRIKELEQELATFKEEHSGELPELLQVNLQMMQRTENQMLEVDRQLRQLKEREIYLQGQLAQLEPNAIMYDAQGRAIQGPEDRLRALEAEYSRVVANYTPDHPDVAKLRKEIDVLRAQLGKSDAAGLIAELKKAKEELASSRERYSDAHPDVKRLQRTVASLERQVKTQQTSDDFKPSEFSKPNNPAYIQLQSQLDAARTEAAALRQTKEELSAKLDDYEARLTSTPEVEKDYRSLTREYDRVLAEYAETRSRQMEAELAESLEQGRKGERFSVIDPPRLPVEPIKPNRWAIALLGLVLSIGLSGGAVAAAEALDDAIYGERGLKNLLGDMGPPLATIPYIPTPAQHAASKATLAAAIGGFVLVIAGALAVVHYTYRPLDILWFTALRKLGLG